MNNLSFSISQIHNKWILILMIIFFTLTQTIAQSKNNFKFNGEGKFKILQFTDIHLDIENQTETDSVINMMTDIIKKENPSLVILTGDIVTSKPVEQSA